MTEKDTQPTPAEIEEKMRNRSDLLACAVDGVKMGISIEQVPGHAQYLREEVVPFLERERMLAEEAHRRFLKLAGL